MLGFSITSISRSFSTKTYHFGGAHYLVPFLKAHPLTQTPLLQHSNLIELVASVFANQRKHSFEMDKAVSDIITKIDVKKQFPPEVHTRLALALSLALKNSATGRKF